MCISWECSWLQNLELHKVAAPSQHPKLVRGWGFGLIYEAKRGPVCEWLWDPSHCSHTKGCSSRLIVHRFWELRLQFRNYPRNTILGFSPDPKHNLYRVPSLHYWLRIFPPSCSDRSTGAPAGTNNPSVIAKAGPATEREARLR